MDGDILYLSLIHILNSPEWTWPEDLNSMLFILTHC